MEGQSGSREVRASVQDASITRNLPRWRASFLFWLQTMLDDFEHGMKHFWMFIRDISEMTADAMSLFLGQLRHYARPLMRSM